MSLRYLGNTELQELYTPRPGESKIGDKIIPVRLDRLSDYAPSYVLLGIPEDIGVRANLGIGGADSLWGSFLQAFLNMQANSYLPGSDILLLGEIKPDFLADCIDSSPAELREKVALLDDEVFPIIEKIAKAGHRPLIIGGGHNNAFPIIKGMSMAVGHSIRVLNMDMHHDFRPLEGRHSGNGFRYAMEDGYLEDYLIWGLSKYYAQQKFLDEWSKNQHVHVIFMESMIANNMKDNLDLFHQYLSTIGDRKFGLEVDMDSIEDISSSAMTPSGFSAKEIRAYVRKAAYSRPWYLHICEGAPVRKDGYSQKTVGKLAAFLVADFVSEYNHSETQW